MFKKNKSYFYAVRISILLAILSKSFIKIGLNPVAGLWGRTH